MKKICYILVIMILINLVPYNAFADDYEIYDKVFDRGQFIELYTNICDSAVEILNSSIDDTKKEEQLQDLFDNYKFDEDEVRSPKDFITVNSYNKEEQWIHMITSGLINTIETKIEDLYYEDKNPINRIDEIDALLRFYKLDSEISKYEVMKLDSKFSSVDIDRDISNIIEEYNTKNQLALSINNVVQRIGNAKESTHIKTILDEYLMAEQLDVFVDSNDLVKVIKKTNDDDKRVKLLFDEIIMKKNEKYFRERIENVADKIIDAIDHNKYYDAANRIGRILRDNHIGHTWNLDDAVANVAEYTDIGYNTKQEAIESEIFNTLKFSYSEEEINTILDEIVSILESVVESENDYESISKENSDEIYEDFLDIVYDYGISDIKQYIIPKDIAYAYYNYEDLGYETAFRSIVDHLRIVLKKSELDDNILKIIKESQYNLPVIIEGVTIVLDKENEYEEYLNEETISEIINSKPENMDAIILNLILDAIIESKKDYIIGFADEMNELNNQGYKDKEIKIANLLNDKKLYSIVDEDEIMDVYIGHNDKNGTLKQELYDELFKELNSSKTDMQSVIKNSIINIIDTMDSNNNVDLDYIINKYLGLSGLNTYVIQNDIKNAYNFPLEYGYSDRRSGIIEVINNGMNEKISSEIRDIFIKDLNESDTEKEIRIILKRNYLDSNMSFTEIKEKYLKQN
ncbi:hypothetical protein R9X47_10265 [Wukongibacter baidiensis]|uniref:hypothetical protein n=1 Tax=Wukongibacter baidiensis TaxID=1723361 RepID=UPI003D7FF96D